MTVMHSHFFILWPKELIAVGKALEEASVEKLTDALLNFPQAKVSDGGPTEYYGKLAYYRKFVEFKKIILPPLYYLTSFFVDPQQDFPHDPAHGRIASHIVSSLSKQDLALLGINIRQIVDSFPLGERRPPKPKKEFLFTSKIVIFDLLYKAGLPFHYNNLSIQSDFDRQIKWAGIMPNPFNYLLEQLKDSHDTNPKECETLIQKAIEMGVKPDDQTTLLCRNIVNKPGYHMLSELMVAQT